MRTMGAENVLRHIMSCDQSQIAKEEKSMVPL